MGRTVLIDADILAYQVASSQEEAYDFGGQVVYSADEEKAIDEVNNAIAWIIDHVDADGAALFLTGTNNFRKQVLPTYKENRKDVRKPQLLQPIRKWMLENTKCFIEDGLEGDDLIGIHATMPHKGERVIWSADKDLKTVPGLHWNPDDGCIYEIDEEEANYRFLSQVITGDPTDNYSGCPGAGPSMVDKTLYKSMAWYSWEHEFTRGPRKGLTEKRWDLEHETDPWKIVLSIYEKAGLTEGDAIIQARCARILRHGEYNFKTQEVLLWQPNFLP